jgi:hypothetical protein
MSALRIGSPLVRGFHPDEDQLAADLDRDQAPSPRPIRTQIRLMKRELRVANERSTGAAKAGYELARRRGGR